MGADIHGWIEMREKDGSWRSSLTIGLPRRDYELFGLMAGVRGLSDPLIQPRGIPDDACSYAIDVYANNIDHSGSWLTLEELKLVKESLDHQNPELNAWIAAMEQLGECRIVFGFDS